MSACFVLVFISLTIFVVKPLFSEIKKAATSVSESREKLISLEKMDKKYIEEVEKDYENINIGLAGIKKQFIDKSEAVKFFEALESVASATSNEIKISASEFPFLTLGLEGTFPDFMKFLGWLENGEYFIDVDSISVSRVGAIGGPENIPAGAVKTILKIKAYINE